jgi:hypothetical protein
MASRGFIGAGSLYLARWNAQAGSFDAPTGPFEAKKFEVSPKSELKKMTSKGRTQYGQVIETVAIPQPAEFSVSFAEVNRDTLLLALLGSSTAVTQGAGNITAETIVAKKGYWVPLSKQNIAAAGFTVTNTGATTTYVLDVDYSVNYAMGWVKILPGSAIVDAASLKVTASYNAISGTKISGATNSQLRAQFIFDGVNYADGLPCIVTVHEAVIAADSAFDFLADDFGAVEMKGELKTPAGKTEPFTVELRDTASA